VHPLSILLEPLELQAAGGLGELLSLLEGAGYDVDETVLSEPYWLQDDTDGTCLGPSGFSECGDSTLWKIRRRPAIQSKKSKRRQQGQSRMDVVDDPERGLLSMFRWESNSEDQQNSNDEEWEFALEVADVNTSSIIGEDALISEDKAECITIRPPLENDKDETLQLGSCESDDAWSWSINEGGVLSWDRNQLSVRAEQRNKFGLGIALGGPIARFLDVISDDEMTMGTNSEIAREEGGRCLWKAHDASALTASCQPVDNHATSKRSLVGFSVIQYQNSAAVSPQLPRFPRNEQHFEERSPDLESKETNPIDEDPEANANLRTMRRSSQNIVNTNDAQNVIGRAPGPHLNSARKSTQKENVRIHEIKSPLGVGGLFENKMMESKIQPESSGSKLLHKPSSPVAAPSTDEIHRPFKIPVHPYIEASNDGYYTDEITGMSYPTDISEYLGHDRKEVGRHTLTGLGIYTKTMLKIKVYGVAFYVSKRDVLNDPGFGDYAGMDADELRQSDSFYKHLMTMGSNPLEGGNFDRTLLIKLNMQLETETVRQSLSAEWQLLTEEHKEILSSSSFRKRDAGERMLEIIQSEENSSNCSCGQSAPPELEADEGCCARGTELVFTWRKSGEMELRVNGMLAETYPQPEIGRGIFFEYLRGDDPMSMDARDHFSDGFPFLLAPLAQLKGFTPKKETNDEEIPPKTKKSAKGINYFVGNLWDGVNTRGNDAISWVQENVNGGISNVNNAFHHITSATQNFGTNLHGLGSELNEKRDSWRSQFIHSQQKSVRMIMSRIPFINRNYESLDLESHDTTTLHSETFSNETRKNVFKPQIAKLLQNFNKQRPLSDEIGVIITPTMNFTHMMFLYLVHFYLVLLLIVSVPDSSTTRLVVKRSSDSTIDSDSDHEERIKELSLDYKEFGSSDGLGPWSDVPDGIPRFVVEKNGVEQNGVDLLSETDHDDCSGSSRQQMQKSLSYFL